MHIWLGKIPASSHPPPKKKWGWTVICIFSYLEQWECHAKKNLYFTKARSYCGHRGLVSPSDCEKEVISFRILARKNCAWTWQLRTNQELSCLITSHSLIAHFFWRDKIISQAAVPGIIEIVLLMGETKANGNWVVHSASWLSQGEPKKRNVFTPSRPLVCLKGGTPRKTVTWLHWVTSLVWVNSKCHYEVIRK
jgi:hypothetical protein